jgi:hypothetical protein
VTDIPNSSSDSFRKLDSAEDEPELQAAEARARRAFGLTGASDGHDHHNTPQITRSQLADRSVGEHQRTRFVQDGDVPVVYVTGSSAVASSSVHGARRLIAAEAALESERNARQGAERALGEAQSTMSDIQTRLDHASLARAEMDEALRELRAEKGELEAQLTLARLARREAEGLLAALANSVARG